jgi:deoxyribodipyrimidine photolyase-related protein
MKTPSKKSYTSLRLVLGDQLNLQHSWYGTVDEKVLYVIAELRQETGYCQTSHAKTLRLLCGYEGIRQRAFGSGPRGPAP